MSIITFPDITFPGTVRHLIITRLVLSDGLPFTSLLDHAQQATEIPLSAQMFERADAEGPFQAAAKTFRLKYYIMYMYDKMPW